MSSPTSAAGEGQPHRGYLANLFELELDDRSQRRAERRLQDDGVWFGQTSEIADEFRRRQAASTA